MPYFCAGCPHNLSTRAHGSDANAGIGCHAMAGWMDRSTTFPRFPWRRGRGLGCTIVLHPTPHRFQNAGRWNLFDSQATRPFARQRQRAPTSPTRSCTTTPSLRPAASRGPPSFGTRNRAPVQAEGVQRIAVVTESDQQWHSQQHLFHQAPRFTRAPSSMLQQNCAPRRGDGTHSIRCAPPSNVDASSAAWHPRAPRGIFIHPELCENCGDCTAVPTVWPSATGYRQGTQAPDRPDCLQSDLSCLQATCPAMVTIEGATLRKKVGAGLSRTPASHRRLPTCRCHRRGTGMPLRSRDHGSRWHRHHHG